MVCRVRQIRTFSSQFVRGCSLAFTGVAVRIGVRQPMGRKLQSDHEVDVRT